MGGRRDMKTDRAERGEQIPASTVHVFYIVVGEPSFSVNTSIFVE